VKRLLGLLAFALGAGLVWWLRAQPAPAPAPEENAGSSVAAPAATDEPAPAFVDEATCAACHPAEAAAWHGSHHDLAMQPAGVDTLLGDFAAAHFEDANGATDFHREGERFLVATIGPDGARASFPVTDAFGFTPLQQVLLDIGKGKKQALQIAWDTTARRWYSLYPGETIPSGDPLHWTRPALNWNFSCAECHATGLRRNYDPVRDAYATTAARFDVGCQACHGPAERHVAWAASGAGEKPGFDAPLKNDGTRQIEACARCHARRAPLGDGFDHRHRLLDDYRPALLDEGLYFADGQIQDEVYEYGSFLQTKMHAQGVRCSDCHEPHSLALRAEGNRLCATCHSATPTVPAHVDARTLARKNYDSPEHHRHAPGTPGSRCIDCHMPERAYMGVDGRRDHGFRIPRPDLAERMASPDPCMACHAERGSQWAADAVRAWFGPKRPAEPFGVALAAGRAGSAGAAEALLALASSKEPPIVRASALDLLTRYPSQPALEAFARGTRDPDGLVRHAALGGLEGLEPAQRLALVGPLCADPLRSVRAEAARLLFDVPAQSLGPFADAFARARDDFEAIQRALLERPEARLNLAQLLAAKGNARGAEDELQAALRLEPRFVPARVNLAELVKARLGESEAEGTLRDGLNRPDDESSAALQHALGLSLVRQGRKAEALVALARAAELGPGEPRFGYVLAVALEDSGKRAEAIAELERVLARAPWHRESAFALSGYRAAAGDEAGARAALLALAAINPHDPGTASAPVESPAPPR
jgi:tetratricopeptide (TPR) repeat protein